MPTSPKAMALGSVCGATLTIAQARCVKESPWSISHHPHLPTDCNNYLLQTGMTALSRAAACGHKAVMARLLLGGADVNLQSIV